jgi:type I restriction enzyme R subunit
MVLLAKWILENKPQARVAIITDRDELDKQIERVFTDAGETICRTSSGRDLMSQLGQPRPGCCARWCTSLARLPKMPMRTLTHSSKTCSAQPSPTVGEVFVFVDECHRTQGGKLHRDEGADAQCGVHRLHRHALLKKDKATSLEVFGGYIHTYKFSEAVEDGVVLDLVYEARDIDQKLGSQDKIDQWFDAKTKALNDWQKKS